MVYEAPSPGLYLALDKLADAFNPSLFVLLLLLAFIDFRKNGKNFRFAQSLLAIACCYLLMIVDKHLGIWSAFGADHSTHSTVAMALVAGLISFARSLQLKLVSPLLVMLLLYYGVELFQQYHSVFDIATSVLAVLPFIYLSFVFPKV